MKRRLFKLVVFLLLGAIVNMAVAWGCAVTIDTSLATHRTGIVDGRDEDWDVIRYSRQGATLLWSQQGSPVRDDDHRRGRHCFQAEEFIEKQKELDSFFKFKLMAA